jgi:hypothetical protein
MRVHLNAFHDNKRQPKQAGVMVDNFSILLSHILIALAFWLLTMRDDLDQEPPPLPDEEPEGFLKRKKPAAKNGTMPGA